MVTTQQDLYTLIVSLDSLSRTAKRLLTCVEYTKTAYYHKPEVTWYAMRVVDDPQDMASLRSFLYPHIDTVVYSAEGESITISITPQINHYHELECYILRCTYLAARS